MSSRNTSESTAAFTFNARAFQTQPIGDPKPETGRLTRDEVDEICPRRAEVQNITDRVASAIRREDYPTSQAYGTPGSTRIDVFENPGTGTICVYDIKTGEKTGLGFARMVELARAARTLYPDSNRIIVTEVRPKR